MKRWITLWIIVAAVVALNAVRDKSGDQPYGFMALTSLIAVLTPVLACVIEIGFGPSRLVFDKQSTFTQCRRWLSIPFLFFGWHWLASFTLTSYRSHHRGIALPLAGVFLLIGFLLLYARGRKRGEQTRGLPHVQAGCRRERIKEGSQ